MSNKIDESVVSLSFDNENFEKNVKQSMSTLEKLKESLKFDDIQDGASKIRSALTGVGSAISTVFNPIGNLLNKTMADLTGFEYLILNSLDRIKYRTVDMIKSLSVDQITNGWQGYAEKTTAVQTIMSATRDQFEDTGKQMEYVEGELAKLSWFTDETSYKFVEMVQSIGLFTGAGVKLDDAVSAMQGIATWAAMSGANANKAASAMYQLSQALGKGYVQAADWRSIETANMATMEFKKVALEAAVAAGTLKKKSDDLYIGMSTGGKQVEVTAENFSRVLTSTNFLTNDVLISALDTYGRFSNKLFEYVDQFDLTTLEWIHMIEKFKDGSIDLNEEAQNMGVSTEELSGYLTTLTSKEMELGFAAFRAAQETKTFKEAIDYVKEAVSSGWASSFEIIFGNYTEAKELWSGLSEELYTIFVESGEVRNEMLQGWKDLGGRTVLLQGITTAYENLKRVIEPVKESFRDFFPKMTSERLFEITTGFKDFVSGLVLTDEQTSKLRKTFDGLFAGLDIVKIGFKTVGERVWDLAKKKFPVLMDGALNLGSNFGDFMVNLRDKLIADDWFNKAIDNISEKFQALSSKIKDIADKALDKIGELKQKFIEFSAKMAETKSFKFLSQAKDGVTTFGQAIGVNLENAFNLVTTKMPGIVDKARTILAGLFEFVKKFYSFVDENGILGKVIGGVIGVWGIKIFKNFGQLIGNISDTIAKIAGLGGKNKENPIKQITSSLMPEDGGALSMSIVDNIKNVLGGVKDALDSFASGRKWANVAVCAAAIAILAASLSELSKIEVSGLVKALPAMAGAITGLVVAFRLISNILTAFNLGNEKKGADKGLVRIGVAMVLIAESIKILTDSMTAFDGISWGDWAKGVLAAITALVAITNTIGNLAGVETSVTAALEAIILAEAVKKFGQAIKEIGEMSWEEIGKGLVGMTVALVEMSMVIETLASIADDYKKVSGGKMLAEGATVWIVASGLKKFAQAVQEFAEMSWEEIEVGLAAAALALGEVLGTIAILTSISNACDSAKNLIAESASIWIVTNALKDLADIYKEFEGIDGEAIKNGLAGLGGALSEMVVAISALDGVNTLLSGDDGGSILDMLGASGSLSILMNGIDNLAEGFTEFATLDTKAISKGAEAMAVALSECVAALGIMYTMEIVPGLAADGKPGGFANSLIGLVNAGTLDLLFAGLDTLFEGFSLFATMNWDDIAKGTVGLAGALISTMGVFEALTSLQVYIAGPGAILANLAGTVTLHGIVQSLDEIADFFVRVGDLDWADVGQGLALMGGALIELTGGSALAGLTSLFSLAGAGIISLVTKSLDDIIDALEQFSKFDSRTAKNAAENMSIMFKALSDIGSSSKFKKSYANAITEIAPSLGVLADSMKKWSGVTVPESFKSTLKALGESLDSFGFLKGRDANNMAKAVDPISTMADSLKNWADVDFDKIYDMSMAIQLIGDSLDSYVLLFDQADNAAKVAKPLGDMADSVSKWQDLGDFTLPDNFEPTMEAFGKALKSFKWEGDAPEAFGQVADKIGVLAKSLKEWAAIGDMPDGWQDEIEKLGYSFKTWGELAGNFGDVIASVASPLGDLWTNGLSKWQGASLPHGFSVMFEAVTDGIKKWASGANEPSAASNLSISAKALGDLADSLDKWKTVSVDAEQFNTVLTAIGDGIHTFSGRTSASNLEKIAKPLGDLATSVSMWKYVQVPHGFQSTLESVALGCSAFLNNCADPSLGNYIGNITTPLNNLATAITAWEGVTIPEGFVGKKGEGFLFQLAQAVNKFNSSSGASESLERTASSLGVLASSMQDWVDVRVPHGFSETLGIIGNAVTNLVDKLNDSAILMDISGPLGELADSVAAWGEVEFTSEVADKMLAFGTACDALSTGMANIGLIDYEGVESFRMYVKSLADTVNNIPDLTDGTKIEAFINALIDLSSIQLDGTEMVEAIDTFADAVQHVIDDMNIIVTSSYEQCKGAMTVAISGFAAALNSDTSCDAAMNSMLDKCLLAAESKEISFANAGDHLANAFIDAIRFHVDQASAAGSELAGGFVTGVEGQSEAAYSAGFNLGSQVIAGIRDAGVGGVGGFDLGGEGSAMGTSFITSVQNSIDKPGGIKLPKLTGTVTPVVDVTKIGGLNFNGAVEMSVGKPVTALNGSIEKLTSIMNTNNSQISSAFNDLKGSVSSLASIVQNKSTDLYVDSRQLASSIVKPMNRELNILSQRS
ncbi:MAG: tape measure protein [Bacteroidaceae bacterium]|nr:tape measure protein [Bacteroidaceae bacterium]